MKILTFGEIMEGGNSVFTTIAREEKEKLIVEFKGMMRVENPYRNLTTYIEELEKQLKELKVNGTVIDLTDFKYCNSNGFYVLMDIIDIVYQNTTGDVTVKRLVNDDWHQETLPILLNLEDEEVSGRTKLVDIKDI